MTLPAPRSAWRYLAGGALALACTGAAFLLHPPLSLTNVALVYVLGAAVAGLRLGRPAAAFSAFLNVALFNFCFVPPRFSFAVADAQYLVSFAVMLAVALVIAQLVEAVRRRARAAAREARRATLLFAFSRELLAVRDVDALCGTARREVEAVFGAPARVLLPDASGLLGAADASPVLLDAAQAALDDSTPVPPGEVVAAAGEWLLLPLRAAVNRLGVLALGTGGAAGRLDPDRCGLLEAFGAQIALALERAQFAAAAESARLVTETARDRD